MRLKLTQPIFKRKLEKFLNLKKIRRRWGKINGRKHRDAFSANIFDSRAGLKIDQKLTQICAIGSSTV